MACDKRQRDRRSVATLQCLGAPGKHPRVGTEVPGNLHGAGSRSRSGRSASTLGIRPGNLRSVEVAVSDSALRDRTNGFVLIVLGKTHPGQFIAPLIHECFAYEVEQCG